MRHVLSLLVLLLLASLYWGVLSGDWAAAAAGIAIPGVLLAAVGAVAIAGAVVDWRRDRGRRLRIEREPYNRLRRHLLEAGAAAGELAAGKLLPCCGGCSGGVEAVGKLLGVPTLEHASVAIAGAVAALERMPVPPPARGKHKVVA